LREVIKFALKVGAIFVCLIVIGAIIAGATGGIKLLSQSTYTAEVTEKEVQRNGDDSKYLIFIESDEGGTKVLENTDELVTLKFNSSDIYGKVEIGETYTFDTIGWRIPFLSMYENIVDVEPSN